MKECKKNEIRELLLANSSINIISILLVDWGLLKIGRYQRQTIKILTIQHFLTGVIFARRSQWLAMENKEESLTNKLQKQGLIEIVNPGTMKPISHWVYICRDVETKWPNFYENSIQH